jgi:cytochrome c553
MIRRYGWALLAIAGLAACAPKPEPGPRGELAWAYPAGKDTAWTPPSGAGPFHMAGSAQTFTKAQVLDDQNPVDWFPDEHPVPPAIVAHSPGNGVTPCAECHGYTGHGSINTPSLNGLSSDYILEQIHAFRDGSRHSAQVDRSATAEMISIARKTSDADLMKAAAYFASLRHGANRKVVEVARVPVTRPDKYGWIDVVPGGGTEPIGQRIIEVSDNMSVAFMENNHIGTTDFVPVGAIARGQALVESGGPAGEPCTACHGADLKGVGNVPPLAGRAPPYLARNLWDIKTGARTGPSVALMQAPAKDLTADQIVDITAYLASRQP